MAEGLISKEMNTRGRVTSKGTIIVPLEVTRLISKFGTASQKRWLKRSDGMKILEQTRRNRKLYKNGLRRLQKLNVLRTVKERAVKNLMKCQVF